MSWIYPPSFFNTLFDTNNCYLSIEGDLWLIYGVHLKIYNTRRSQVFWSLTSSFRKKLNWHRSCYTKFILFRSWDLGSLRFNILIKISPCASKDLWFNSSNLKFNSFKFNLKIIQKIIKLGYWTLKVEIGTIVLVEIAIQMYE